MKPRETAPAERRLAGRDIGLPMLESVSAIHGLNASRIPWHEHRGYELLFALGGGAAYEFADGRTVDLAGGHFMLVPPRVRHRGLHDVRAPVGLCGIVFDLRRRGAGRATPFGARDRAWMTRRFEETARRARPMGAELRRLATALNRQAAAFGEAADRAAAAASLRWLACGVLLEAVRQPDGPGPGPARRAAEAALAHLRGHFREPLPAAELARRAGCSRSRFFQVFKAATGMTPNDYLQRLRLDHAREALAQEGGSVTDIAFAAGFSSSQYFSHVFRKYTGLTPTRYRRVARRARGG